MDSTDQARTGNPTADTDAGPAAGGGVSAGLPDLAELLAEISRLADLDPSEAAEPAARLADVLGAALEDVEEDH